MKIYLLNVQVSWDHLLTSKTLLFFIQSTISYLKPDRQKKIIIDFSLPKGPGFGLTLTLNIEQYDYTRDPSFGVGIMVLKVLLYKMFSF